MPSPSDCLSRTTSYVKALRCALDQCLLDLKDRVFEGDRLNHDLLDRCQVEAYDLAMAAAEWNAAVFVLNYAEKTAVQKGEQTLEIPLALVFCAETLLNIRNRLTLQSADALTREDDSALLDCCRYWLSSEALDELGGRLLEQKGYLGDPLLDEDHAMMRDTFTRFTEEVVMPLAQDIHRQDAIVPPEILDQVRELGCFGISIPESYGGLQEGDREDPLGMIVVTEALSRGSLAAAGSLITRPEILARALLKGGTEEQKQYWLPRLAAGEPLCAVAVTEPDYGSDVARMKLKAIRSEGGWILNGQKTWCTFAGMAGVLMVLARTDPDPAAGHKGLSMFLVEKTVNDGQGFRQELPGGGILTGKAIPTLGYRGMHSFDLFFDNVFVPDSHLLGGEAGLGKGFYFTMAGFSGGRIQTAARAIGVMQAAYEQAISYAAERKVFGQPIGHYSLTRAKLAKMAAFLTAGRQFTYAVGRLMEQGGGDMEASMVKFFTCKTAEWVAREAMQIHGGMGYAEETPASRFFVDARVLSIFEGAEEVLALKVIAPALLKRGRI